jgi:hypothetical protein
MDKKDRRRPCRLCGKDLNTWGPDRRGICPDCASARRKTLIRCAGRCKRLHELGRMESVVLNFTPGKKGGRKLIIYYCLTCLTQAQSRATTIFDEQQEAISKAEARLKRGRNGG